jgi:GNAT superfamily N-acetyltransferase
VLVGLLVRCYAPLLTQLPVAKVSELRCDWDDYDDAVHSEPDTVGASGLLTCRSGQVIGFAPWDPRGWPEVGRVGHNCIIPEFQGRGYGRRQVEEVLNLFREKNFRGAQVRTDEHPFFEPARRMYGRCGFRLIGREPGVLLDGFELLVYEQTIFGGG